MKTTITIFLLSLVIVSCSNRQENEQLDSSNTKNQMSIEEIKTAISSGAGKVVEKDSVFLIDASAKDQVKLVLSGGDGCGGSPGCGKYEYLRNTSTDRRIRATVKTSWIYNNQPQSETLVYDTDPGVEIFLGCTAWCSSYGGRQDFKRSIVGATYIN